MWEGAVLRQFLSGGLVDVVIRPVRLFVDEPLLVVQQRVEQDETLHPIGVPGSEEGGDSTGEAGPDQRGGRPGTLRGDAVNGHPDVVGNCAEREILLPAIALPVPAEGEPRGCDPGCGQSGGQSGEEATLLAGDTAAVYQDGDGTRRL